MTDTAKLDDPNYLQRLRTVGHIEGASTLVLFGIAMPLKYFADMPMAVRIVGTAHGVLFTILAFMCVRAMKRVPIGMGLGMAGIIGAVFPFGPFIVDRWLKDLERED